MRIALRQSQAAYWRGWVVMACSGLFWNSPGFAQPTAAQTTRAAEAKAGDAKPVLSDEEREVRVKKFLRALDADTLAERDAAEKQLIELGPTTVNLLPKETSSTGAELKARLQRIREQLGTSVVKKSIEPSSVTLHGEHSVAVALAKITEQTGNKFSIESPPAKNISFDLDAVPFWKAFDFLLDQAGLDVDPFNTDGDKLILRAKLPDAQARGERASYAGIFRIEPLSIEATRSLRSETQNSLRLTIWLAWEPRLQPVFIQFPMKDVQGALNSGDDLKAASPDSSPEYSTNTGPQIQAEMLLTLPKRADQAIANLKGQFIAAIPSQRVQLEFDKLDKSGRKSQQVGDLNVALERVRKNGGIYEVVSLIRLTNAGQTMDSFRGWMMSNEAYLLDDKNQRVENVGLQTYRMTGDEVGISYLFDMSKGPDKYRFIYDAPASVLQERVDFEMRLIPLP